jgi:mono/diheme cytochrome c family protein
MANSMPCARAVLSVSFLLAAAICSHAALRGNGGRNLAARFYFSLPTSPNSGQEMYTQYCAGCHGSGGQGQGPAARYCTVSPANLALLAKNNHGVFPANHVSQVLHTGTGKRPKGQGYMPVWEPLLRSMNADKPDTTELRIANLTEYVRTLQEHPSASQQGRAAP